MADLTFKTVRDTNNSRCRRWHPGFNDGTDPWNGADWSNAMQGEAGEAGNVVKKIRRLECHYPDYKQLNVTMGEFREQLGDELADTFLYLDLLAQYYGVDLAAAIVRKFNLVSEANGFPERLPTCDCPDGMRYHAVNCPVWLPGKLR